MTAERRTIGTFAEAQSQCAGHRIAACPLRENKRPVTKGYNRVGLRGSRDLAHAPTSAPIDAKDLSSALANDATANDQQSARMVLP
jgi:hypothetical protein